MSEWRAITVRYPWSALIVDGLKPVENRSSGFPKTYRGGVLIHEAQKKSDRGMKDLRAGRAYARAQPRRKWPMRQPGCYIGRAMLVDAHDAHEGCCESEFAEQWYVDANGRRRNNPVHLVFDRPKRFRYPMWDRGQLGLWTPIPQMIGLLPL